MVGTCPGCGAARQTAFRTEGDPLKATVLLRQLGDARPSAILTVALLAAELDRCVGRCATPPEDLAPAAWRASLAATSSSIQPNLAPRTLASHLTAHCVALP